MQAVRVKPYRGGDAHDNDKKILRCFTIVKMDGGALLFLK
jgi:hypothetical protein